MLQCQRGLTILFTKSIKQLLFCLYINKEEVIKTSYCRWIFNRHRPLPKHKMRVISLDIATDNRTEQFFFKFVSPILNIGFLKKFFLQSPHQNKSRPAREIFPIWTRGNIYFLSHAGKQRENYFHISPVALFHAMLVFYAMLSRQLSHAFLP